ncbi:porin [Phyllobacterium meliloti]|uniref:porin n=1 Tax=Phyllobacterium meliloti TaxID=555317 RepID=UPI000DD9BFF9|nr:porin [Phyllobacterium sp. T1293]UGX87922.1 porin [Phyllobacterium sp. T1293]
MNIKSLLLGSAAALVAVTGARAADAVVVAEPEAVEYVRVCDAYGKGFYYIPGSATCLKVSGYVRFDAKGGDDVSKGGKLNTWKLKSRATVRFDARSDTELGTLRSYAETRFNYENGENKGAEISHAYIELGGFRIGTTDSLYDTWTGSAGNVINDGVIAYAGDQDNQVSYTFAGGNGFSALIGLEQGDKDHLITDYTPHIIAGAKFEQGWGGVSGVVGYDSVVEEFAGKVRLDVKLTDTLSAFVLGGYQSGYGDHAKEKRTGSYYGTWNGDWAVWGGLTAKVSDKAEVNAQLAYESEGTYAGALNVAYELVPGFKITPEINYTKFDGARKNALVKDNKSDDAFGGMIRFQRNF